MTPVTAHGMIGTRRNQAQPGTTRRNQTQPGTTRHNQAQPAMIRSFGENKRLGENTLTFP